MKKNLKKISPELLLLILLIFLGLYFRHLNLFFEDYWIDEMLSFSNANPNISFSDTLDKVKSSERTPALFFLILKYIFKLFQYHPDVGRYFIMILGVSAIPIAFLISKELHTKKSAILFSFFISANIYLINYSQEVRVYTLLFLLSLINIFLFLKVINENKKKLTFFDGGLFITNILGFSAHPFFFIIIISEISYCLIKIFLNKEKLNKIFLILIFSLIISFLIQYDYLMNLKAYESVNWIQSGDYLNTKFLTDLYFRKFFGSKIMGAIYFFSLLSLIFLFRKIIIYSNHYLLFIIIILFSYLIPIFYGSIKQPVLFDRYIIFVLIPIFVLLSSLIYEIKNRKAKKILILILVITTLSNLYLELANKYWHHKPQTVKLLNLIYENSQNKNSINLYLDEENGIPTFHDYVIKLEKFKKNNFKIIKKNELSFVNDFWLICYVDVCLTGICYKDIEGEHQGTEIPNWPIKFCSDTKGINNNYKMKEIFGKNTNPYQKILGKYYTK